MDEWHENAPSDHYLTLHNYSLRDNDSKFFVQNGNNYLAVVNWDSISQGTNNTSKTGHYARKRIPVRYSEEGKNILIPVSRSQHAVLFIVIIVIIVVSILLGIYFFIGLPIQVLINISKGKAFTLKNISHLRKMTYFMFIYASLSLFSPYLLKLFFWKMIPNDFALTPFWLALLNNLYLFFIAAILMMISVAFNRAHLLQREQELTV